MARKLEDFPNSVTPDSDYPYGRIRDRSGSTGGTPVNEYTNGDIHQFFAKMMAEAGVTPNGQPDNDYSGFQFFEALGLLSRYKTVSVTSNSIALGSKTFAVGEGYAYAIGNRLRVTDSANATNYMDGVVTAYSVGDLTILVDNIGGSGTKVDWNINLGSLSVIPSATLTLLNSYGAATFIKYKKDGFGNVYLSGEVQSPSPVTSVVFGTLPAGFRPAVASEFPVGHWTQSQDNVICYVETNGECRLYVNGSAGTAVDASKVFNLAPVRFNVNA